MAYTRQFLVSPALARLIRKERGTQGRVQEGYFSSTPERTHFVRLDPPNGALVMGVQGPDGQPTEEVTEVPLSQAQALLDVAPGKISYERTVLVLAPGVEGALEQILLSRPLHLLTVAFEDATAAERFQEPPWAGPEVSGDALFSKAAIALQGEPQVGELEISNASLEALLDLLQSRFSPRHSGALPAWGYSAHRVQESNPTDEQLLAGLAQALGSDGHESTDSISLTQPLAERRAASSIP
jgi:CYTH domain-containing protein